MSSASRSFYAKKWDPVFSADRKFKEDWSRPYVELKRNIEASGDGIELFYRDSDGSIPACRVEELKKFAAPVSVDDVKAGRGSAGLRHGAWLDERSIAREAREHKNPLTATQLYQRRKIPRIGSGDVLDSDRCLIYINHWDASFILALTETAVDHEVPLLRDAIWKHHDRQTSLKVRIPTKGFKIFQLEFHVKYWVFGPSPVASETEHREAAGYSMKWTDLSFLEIQTPEAPVGRRHGMFEAHFSFVICGSHEKRWAAYSFDDTEFDDEDLYDKIFPCEGVHADPIASDDDTDAERPIWDAREYFLKIVSSRVRRATDSWDELLRPIERSIQEYRERHPSTLSQLNSRKRDRSETVKTFDWTRQAVELVNKLRKTLSDTNTLWKHFNSGDGDIDYFSESSSESISSDTVQNRIKLSREINETFQRLEALERTLEYLSASCNDSVNALQLRLTLESSEEMKSSGAITNFSTFVLAPILGAFACLQTSPNLMPLPLGPAMVILIVVFMATFQMLHAIFGALPAIDWWWRVIKAPVKVMKVEGMGNSPYVGALGNPMRKRPRNIDRTAPDVEMGPVLA